MLAIFDLDGTLWKGEEPYPNAVNLVNFIEQKSDVVFFSNTSTRTSADLSNKLLRLGFNVHNNVYTTASEAVRYLVDNKYESVYAIGSSSFIGDIVSNGIEISYDANAVIVGLDYDFSYWMIEIAVDIILKGGKFIVCNEDKLFPTEIKLKPGLAVITGAIEKVTGKSPDFNIGKPNTYIIENIMKDYNVIPRETIIIGDSEENDMLVAERAGCKGILVKDGYNHFRPVYNFFQ